MSGRSQPSKLEWLDAKTHREPVWPLAGYAPGKYTGRCSICNGDFWDMDKRAYHCFPCAVDAVKASAEGLATQLRAVQAENASLRLAFQTLTGNRQ